MSNSSKNTPSNQSEEVDLGQLFSLIGNAFNRFFNFLGSIFKGLFDLLVSLLVVFRKNLFGFTMSAVIGGSIGLFIQSNSPVLFEGSMVVEPNFQSSRQLYNNISYYNTLVTQKDSVQLSKVLGIEKKQAARLTSFNIEPVVSESSKLMQYNELIISLDSISREEVTYESFLNALDPIDYIQHKIVVSSEDRNIYPLLRKPILASISDNEYFKEKQLVALRNIALNDSLTLVSLQETDSLRIVYERVLLEEAKKETASTSIIMEQQTENNKELALLDRKLELQKQLERNNEYRLDGQEILKVISDFPEVGYVKIGFFNGYLFKGSVIGVFLFALWLIVKAIDAFLLKRIKE